MTAFQFLLKDGKDKALTFSYDDGQVHDRRLVSTFDAYGMKATFHLNSGTLGEAGYVEPEELPQLYAGHEIACHGVTHPYFNQLSADMMLRELAEDRRALEEYSGRLVRGFSYPFGEYNQTLLAQAKAAGIVYSRTVESTMQFNLPSDFLLWHPTCHHNQVTEKLVQDFLNAPEYRNLSLFYIWGHSFEFAREDNWDRIETICESLQGRPDVWYATNGEIYEYVMAMRSLITSVDGNLLYNPTATTLFLEVAGRMVTLEGGKRLDIRNCVSAR